MTFWLTIYREKKEEEVVQEEQVTFKTKLGKWSSSILILRFADLFICNVMKQFIARSKSPEQIRGTGYSLGGQQYEMQLKIA